MSNEKTGNMARSIDYLIWRITVYSFGLFNYFLYLGLSLRSGNFFRKTTEKDENRFLLARDRYWNLSKPIHSLYHRFLVLRDGRQLHYLTNLPVTKPPTQQSKPLVILIHGFPDSALLWRYILDSPVLRQNAALVAVDLPGCGGSDSFPHYGTGEVLEALTEFIVAMREEHIQGDDNYQLQDDGLGRKVFIVGHDWGSVLGFRLAAEASCLADRFILTNAPHAELARANVQRITNSCKKMLKSFAHSPLANRHCFSQAIHAFKPLGFQLLLFGYIFAFQLPIFMVKYLGTGGNSSFVRGAHKVQYGKARVGYDPHESMAISMGPGEAECQTSTEEDQPQRYSESVLRRAKDHGAWFVEFSAYYRDGLAFDKWEKSIYTLGAFHNIEIDNENYAPVGSKACKRRASSTSSTLFTEIYTNSLRAPATIVWGEKDQACSEQICLDGIGDYLTPNSQVLLLPDTGHWTPFEKPSRETIKAILEYLVRNGDVGKKDLEVIVQDTYPGAFVSIEK